MRVGQARRRDVNEPEIRQALARVGAQTFPLSGSPAPDLLVWFRGREYVMEIKSDRGKKRKDEAHDVPWPVVTSIAEALRLIGVQA